MSSPITFSGFNNIDFNTILNAMMQAAAQPLTDLQTHQSALTTRGTNFSTLASRASIVQSVANDLSDGSETATLAATSSDSTSVAATATDTATRATYSVDVIALAAAQVSVSSSWAPDANTTTVADSGTLTIGGVDVQIDHAVTLQGLADAINNTKDITVAASVVRTNTGKYQLVLKANNTGDAGAFTVDTTALTGGQKPLTFDGTKAVNPQNAHLKINGVDVYSASNDIEEAAPGLTFTALKPTTSSVTVTVAPDGSALKTRIQSFITAFNSLTSFVSTQTAAASNGDDSSIGHDPFVRSLRQQLRSAVTARYTGGTYEYLAAIGIEFTQSGTLQLNSTRFDAAMKDAPEEVAKLVSGSGAGGAFGKINTLLKQFTESGGLLSAAQKQLTQAQARLTDEIDAMTSRLIKQRADLQAQFTAADAAMAQLKNQSGTLANVGSSLTAAM